VCFFHEFLQVLQLRHFLAQNLTYPRRNRRYSLSQMVLALVYPIDKSAASPRGGNVNPANNARMTERRLILVIQC
jgi:hypothetical protein